MLPIIPLLFMLVLWVAAVEPAQAAAEPQPAVVNVSFAEPVGPLDMGRMALGQGGLSPEPMWDDRIAEIRALRPKLIRLFIQEYFDLLPAPAKYNFAQLDRSVDTILRTGAKPLMCICFKPRVLFPKIDQDVVEPVDYGQWEELIFNLVKHYRDRGAGIRYWEIGNEPDIGEDGGCPYRFRPDSYVRYYQRTAAAIRRADPQARVGGPALANVRSPILPSLLAHCQAQQTPLDFVSWHIYSSDPAQIRGTIQYVRQLLARYPTLKPELFLDEWNMDLMNPPRDPRFHPCYVAEAIWQMVEAGLDYSCYYHIRDYHVEQEQFVRFMSPQGTAFMARWWNRMPQYHGLFDYQNTVRPAYFTFKLLARMSGQRLRLASSHDSVHGFAARDQQLQMDCLMLWNFSTGTIPVQLHLNGLPKNVRMRHVVLDSAAANNEENSRLRFMTATNLSRGDHQLSTVLEPYAVHFWSFE